MLEYEAQIRIGFFFIILIGVAWGEFFSPKRTLTVSKRRRWVNNLGIIVIGTILIKLTYPATAMTIATAATTSNWGLFNLIDLPIWVAIPLAILILDLVIYLQHLMFHAVPLLWRLHMVHHADLDLDVSSGLRFHPIEIIISMAIKMAVVAALGVPIVAVLLFEIILNATAMFNHGNIHLPTKLDRWLRLLVVTPDMHRVHHSVLIRETNRNFGFNFPWWDRLFGTYRAQPVAGHQQMTIGLSQFRKVEELSLLKLLVLPYTGDEGYYSLKYAGEEPKAKRDID